MLKNVKKSFKKFFILRKHKRKCWANFRKFWVTSDEILIYLQRTLKETFEDYLVQFYIWIGYICRNFGNAENDKKGMDYIPGYISVKFPTNEI